MRTESFASASDRSVADTSPVHSANFPFHFYPPKALRLSSLHELDATYSQRPSSDSNKVHFTLTPEVNPYAEGDRAPTRNVESTSMNDAGDAERESPRRDMRFRMSILGLLVATFLIYVDLVSKVYNFCMSCQLKCFVNRQESRLLSQQSSMTFTARSSSGWEPHMLSRPQLLSRSSATWLRCARRFLTI